MSAQSQKFDHMSVEEFLALEEAHPEGRYEYIDGYVRDLRALLLAGGTNNHSQIAMNIGTELNIVLRKLGRKCRVYSADVKVRLTESRYVHPDVSVSCDQQDAVRHDSIASPCLVVEVLSPSTEMYDRSTKLQMYSSCLSIQEYMLVDATRHLVEVYHRLPNDRMEYSTYGKGDTITLSGLGVDITVDSIYYDLTFE